jgi:cyanophycinase
MKQKITTSGPEPGSLLLHGGVGLDTDNFFKKLFLDLAGGADGLLIYCPTAFSEEQLHGDQKKHTESEFAAKRFGFNKAVILHTRDREEANSESFVEPITKATAFFFTGGRQWRLAESYLRTRFHDELNRLLQRGGVIAGSSAGATIQGSFLVRGSSEPDDHKIMLGNYREGFGFITNSAIDQHVLARNRLFDMVEVVHNYPELLGIGIDEETSIYVRGNEFTVIGKSYVAIYDGTFFSKERNSFCNLEPESERFYLLPHGCRYDMKSRKISFLSRAII